MRASPNFYNAAVVLGMVLFVACGGPEPTSTPTLLPSPTPTLSPAPTTSIITPEHLPGMVLTQADIEVVFPLLQLDPDTGFVDNEAAAEATMDPDDTGLELAAQGRLDGYEHAFSDFQVLLARFQGDILGRPFGIESSVDLFDTPESAQAYIRRRVEDFHRFQGREIDGTTLEKFQELVAPDIGTDTVAGTNTFSSADVEFKGTNTFIFWRRESVVGSVAVVGVDEVDWTAATERLTRGMDQRIYSVLTGEINVKSIVPTNSAPTPSENAEEAARGAGFDLPAMIPTLADLREGAVIESERFLEDPDTISSYAREFGARGLVFELGSSQVIVLGTTVKLYAIALQATLPIELIGALGATAIGDVIGPSLAESTGVTPYDLKFELLELPPIGDAIAGLMMKMDTAVGNYDAYLLFFARGRISSQLFVMGPVGKVVLEDVIALAQHIDERIRQNSPAT